MLILGIETSCDETAAAVLEIKNDGIKIISNVVSSQIKIHAPYGGVVPSLAAREHTKNLPQVLKEALRQAQGDFDMNKIDLIAVTAGPGLIPCLLTGTAFAKTLAFKYKKPIIGVNHIEGHIMSNWLQPIAQAKSEKLKIQNFEPFPAVCLVVSGGHTSLILMNGFGKYKLIGETVDDAAGEAFDKIARILELGYPGGPAIAGAAERKTKSEKIKIELPRPMIHSKDFNFSFAGLKTAVLYQTRELLKSHSLDEIKTEMACEAQEAITDVLTQKTINAAKKYSAKSIMLSGGVSANTKLREKFSAGAKKIGIPFFSPEIQYTGDNAAMIALAGYIKAKNLKRKAKSLDWKEIEANANWEIV